MRDYGVVRTRFWEWAKRKSLSPEAKEMALYLLTCPHGNSLGCFRLPVAYIREDMGKTEREVTFALGALSAVGFLCRDMDSGWTWVVGFLEHNPIPNGKVGKAIGKMLEMVPPLVPFYADLLAGLHGLEHFPPDLIDQLRIRYLASQDTVSRGSGTHTPTPTHIPIPTHTPSLVGAGAPTPKRKTTLPKDWKATKEELAYAAEQGCPNPPDTAERFRLHHLSKGTLAVDWGLGFQYWCRNEKKFNGGGSSESYGDKRAREVQEAIERSKLQ